MLAGIPPYVLIARITSILGMSFSLAIGLLFLIGGWIGWSVIVFLFFIPSFALLAVVERYASEAQKREAERQAGASASEDATGG